VRKYLISFITLGMMVFVSQADALQVTILMSEDNDAYHEFADSFISESQRNKLSLEIQQTNSLPSKSDLIIAVGLNSAIIASASRLPVLCVFISKAGFRKIVRGLPVNREKNTFSAIYLDQPINRQVAMVAAALPEIKSIGLLYSYLSPDLENYRKAIIEKGFALREKKLESADSLYRDLDSLLEKSNVLLAIPDTEVYNSLTMRNILMTTYRRRVPVVGFSSAYVKAGALCAVFSTPSQIAVQAVSLTGQFIDTPLLPVAQYPAEFYVMFNQQVARSLGISIKENVALIREIEASENDKQGGD
jgi:ABC-type uncharacterized transport system substrate-binding protein